MITEYNKIIKDVFPRVIKKMGYPPINGVKLDKNIKTANISFKTYNIKINPNFLKKICPNNENIEQVIEAILDHEIGHYTYFPWDLKTKLIAQAAISNFKHKKTILNFYSDVIDNLNIIQNHPETNLNQLYKKINQINKPGKLTQVLQSLYTQYHQKDYGIKITDLNNRLKNKLDSLLRLNYFDPNNLIENIQSFAYIIQDLIKPDQNLEEEIIFDESGDNIKNILKQMGKEMPEKILEDVIDDLDNKDIFEKRLIYYESISHRNKIKIKKKNLEEKVDNNYPSELKQFENQDSIKKLNIFASFGEIIPPLAKVWKYDKFKTYAINKNCPNCLILIDYSISMKNPLNKHSFAVESAFIAARTYLLKGAEVAIGTFNNETKLTDFSKDKNQIYKALIKKTEGHTKLDTKKIKELLKKTKKPTDIFMISDLKLNNFDEFHNFLKELDYQKNRMTIAWIKELDINKKIDSLKELNNKIGLYKIENMKDICQIIMGSINFDNINKIFI